MGDIRLLSNLIAFLVLNGEEPAGGRLIVHVPAASSSLSPLEHAPSTTSTAAPPRALSRPQSAQPHPPEAGSSKVPRPSRPPSKKFRADHNAPKLQSRPLTTHEDPALEEDVRAMNDEADYLRRKSRSNPTPSRMQAPIRFPPTTTPTTNRRKPRDTSINIPEQETPQLERNKQLRDVAMAGVSSSDGAEPSSSQTTPRSGGHRRRSSVGSRGKRISEVFENTGVICKFLGWFLRLIVLDLHTSSRCQPNHITQSPSRAFTSTLILTCLGPSVSANS